MQFHPDRYHIHITPRTNQFIGHVIVLENILSYHRIISIMRRNLFDPYAFTEEARGNLTSWHTSSLSVDGLIALRGRIK
jgi:hypothetical protein